MCVNGKVLLQTAISLENFNFVILLTLLCSSFLVSVLLKCSLRYLIREQMKSLKCDPFTGVHVPAEYNHILSWSQKNRRYTKFWMKHSWSVLILASRFWDYLLNTFPLTFCGKFTHAFRSYWKAVKSFSLLGISRV